MKRPGIIIFVFFAALSSCNNNSNNGAVPTVGITDSTAIAQDTATQMSIENSYEYIKTLTANEKLVYDVIAFGGSAQKGQYAIIRRGADNKPDTIAQGERKGIIANAFLADLNNNRNNEIYIILQSADSNKYGNVIAYELDKRGKVSPIFFPYHAKDMVKHLGYLGKDSIFTAGKFLIQRFPIYKENEPICCPSGGWGSTYYVLRKNRFIEVSF